MYNIEAEKEGLMQEIKDNLPKVAGIEHCLTIGGVSMRRCEEIVMELTGEQFDIIDMNGVDQDWGEDIIIGEDLYHVWGSVTSGSLCFQLKK